MDTTTLSAFWEGVGSTTEQWILGNWSFFTIAGMAIIVIMVLGGLILTMTMFFKNRRRKWR